MKKTVSLLLAVLLFAGLGTAAFAEETPNVVGTVTDDLYCNEFLGIQFKGNEMWQLLDAEETAQVMGYTVENVINDEDLMKQLEESGVMYDFLAVKLDGSNNSVNVILEDLGVLYGSILKMDTLMDMLEKQLNQSLAGMGYQNLKITQETVEFAGEERPAFLIEGDFSGVHIYEREVLIRQDQILGSVTIASVGMDTLDEDMALFQPIAAEEAAAA